MTQISRRTGVVLFGLALLAVVIALVALLPDSSGSGGHQATPTAGPTTSPSRTTAPASASPGPVIAQTPAQRTVSGLRLVNYYPATGGWEDLWEHYDHATVAADFTALQGLGANAVRVIVQPDAVGFPVVRPAARAVLDDLLSTASAHGLRVQVTLFDRWSDYEDQSGSARWVSSLLSGHQDDRRIVLVELQNNFRVSQPGAVPWGRQVMGDIKTILPNALRTVSVPAPLSVTGVFDADRALGRGAVQVLDLHFYSEASHASSDFAALARQAGSRPALVGEAGFSSDQSPQGTTAAGEEAQARFYRLVYTAARDAGLPPPAPWTTNDFTAGAIPFAAAEPEHHFGLRRTDGSLKPAAAVVRAALAGRPVADVDGGFERESAGPTLWGSWSVQDAAEGRPYLSSTARTGVASACFRGTSGSDAGVPSLVQSFPLTSTQPRAGAWVLHPDGTGIVTVALAFFDGSGSYLGDVESKAASTGPGWQQLSVTGPAPVGATTYSVALKARYQATQTCFDDVTVASND